MTGFFIFAPIKPNTPLIQAHFVGSFRPVVRFVVIFAAGFFIYFHICTFYAIYIENEVYFCPIKLKQPHDENSNNKLDYLQHTCRGCNGW